MPPNADRQTAEKQQQRTEAKQSSTGTTAAIMLASRPLRAVEGFVIPAKAGIQGAIA
jgi:hypothetical protein